MSDLFSTGFWLVVVSTLLLASFVVATFYLHKIKKGGVSSKLVDAWTLSFSLTGGAAVGLIVYKIVRILCDAVDMDENWEALIGWIVFIYVTLNFTRYLWGNAAKEQVVALGFVGVILILGKRDRDKYLEEGIYRINPLISVHPVDMRQQRIEISDIEEPSSNGIKMTVQLIILYKIEDPDNSLDVENPQGGIKGAAVAATRTHVRGEKSEDLMTNDSRNGLATKVIKKIKEYNKGLGDPNIKGGPFIDKDSIKVQVEKLQPPESILAAAAAAEAQIKVNEKRQAELDGLLERMEVFIDRAVKQRIKPEDAALMFQRSEKMIQADEFIIRGLQGFGRNRNGGGEDIVKLVVEGLRRAKKGGVI